MSKYRITDVTTKAGDKGQTNLVDHNVSKTSSIISLLGDIDEANSSIGLARYIMPELSKFQDLLGVIQNNLFDLSADIICKSTKINDTNISYLEDAIHSLNSTLPPLTSFIIPNSPIHYARTVVRRTERSFWNYHIDHQENSTLPGKYLNRLSDLLFIIARALHTSETLWKREK